MNYNAIHEAAHTVIAVYFGKEVTGINMLPDVEYCGEIGNQAAAITYVNGLKETLDDVKIILAGMCATKLFSISTAEELLSLDDLSLESELTNEFGVADDYNKAVDILVKLSCLQDMPQLMRDTIQLINSEHIRNKIIVLSKVLQHDNHFSSNTIDSILWDMR